MTAPEASRHGEIAVSDEFSLPSLTSVQDAFRTLTDTAYMAGSEIARRASADLPGLAEVFDDRVVLVVGGQAHGPLGWFAQDKWRLDETRYDEIHVNVGHASYAAGTSARKAEDVLDTIGHELVHLYARSQAIRDTSGGGRYHNKRFALLAHTLGLRVVRSPAAHIGFTTVGLNAHGHEAYGDLVADLEAALRLSAEPAVRRFPPASAPAVPSSTVFVPGDEPESPQCLGKYVFARCGCRDERGRPRTLRMARGWWQPGTVGCATCREVFRESPHAVRKPNTGEGGGMA